jgi:hypothetical protein
MKSFEKQIQKRYKYILNDIYRKSSPGDNCWYNLYYSKEDTDEAGAKVAKGTYLRNSVLADLRIYGVAITAA